jgi:hypothetical protein
MSSTKTSLSTLSDNTENVKQQEVNTVNKTTYKPDLEAKIKPLKRNDSRDINILICVINGIKSENGMFEYKYKDKNRKQRTQNMYKDKNQVFTTYRQLCENTGFTLSKVTRLVKLADTHGKLVKKNLYKVKGQFKTKEQIGLNIFTTFCKKKTNDLKPYKIRTKKLINNDDIVCNTISTPTPEITSNEHYTDWKNLSSIDLNDYVCKELSKKKHDLTKKKKKKYKSDPNNKYILNVGKNTLVKI